jgi:hypothetical protein
VGDRIESDGLKGQKIDSGELKKNEAGICNPHGSGHHARRGALEGYESRIASVILSGEVTEGGCTFNTLGCDAFVTAQNVSAVAAVNSTKSNGPFDGDQSLRILYEGSGGVPRTALKACQMAYGLMLR